MLALGVGLCHTANPSPLSAGRTARERESERGEREREREREERERERRTRTRTNCLLHKSSDFYNIKPILKCKSFVPTNANRNKDIW